MGFFVAGDGGARSGVWASDGERFRVGDSVSIPGLDGRVVWDCVPEKDLGT